MLAFLISEDPLTTGRPYRPNGTGHRADPPPPDAPAPPGGPVAPGPAPARSSRSARRASLALNLACLGIILMGFNRIRVAGWTVSDAAFLASAAVALADILAGREGSLAPKRSRRSSPPILLGTIVLLTAGTLSAFQALNTVESMLVVVRFAWIAFGLLWALRAVSANPERLDKLLAAWRVMVILNCVIAITGQLGITNFSAVNDEDRQTGFFEQPNEFAGLLVVGLPLFLLGVPRRGEPRSDGRELLDRGLKVALVVYAIATTGSMTNILAALVGAAVALATGGWRHIRQPGRSFRSPLMPMAAAVVCALGIVALARSDLSVVDRFDRYTSGDDYVTGSVGERSELNAEVTSHFDDLLFLGRGFDSESFDELSADDDPLATHNMFLLLLLQAGLPALLGLLTILGFTAKHGTRLVSYTKGTALHATAIALLASFASANTFAQFQPTQYQRYYWLPTAFLGVLWALCRERARATAALGPDGPGPGAGVGPGPGPDDSGPGRPGRPGRPVRTT